jgi:hypothetical protein
MAGPIAERDLEFARMLEFSPAWFELGVVNQEFLDWARSEWDKGEDENKEHYRYAAFCRFLENHRPLNAEIAIALYRLGHADPEPGMGSAMMVRIIFQPTCPEVVLSEAERSGERQLVRAVERRRLLFGRSE